ncbi:MAG TPA: hypothetical protein VN764_15170, partial [Polyangiaceae bacterium]|nr:hypothetical protein [Polyangiaceae bacterium]
FFSGVFRFIRAVWQNASIQLRAVMARRPFERAEAICHARRASQQQRTPVLERSLHRLCTSGLSVVCLISIQHTPLRIFSSSTS